MTYSCSCFSGYKEDALKDGNATCVPVVCRVPPEEKHAFTKITKDVDYDGDAVRYDCDEGYSLNGRPKNDKNAHFFIECQKPATFSMPEMRVPVVCGEFPSVAHSDRMPKQESFVFPESAEYTCEECYSLDTDAKGPKTFEVKRQADGKYTAPKECKAVICPTPEAQPESILAKVQDVYTCFTPLRVACVEGYSMDHTTNPMSFGYTQACHADRTFDKVQDCKPIKCLTLPVVNHTKREDGVRVYKETVEYTADEGYTLNCKADGETKFTIECQSDGTYSKVKSVCAVECGKDPERKNAQGPGCDHSFPEVVPYNCLKGHSPEEVLQGREDHPVLSGLPVRRQVPRQLSKTVVPPHSKQVSGPDVKDMVFMDISGFECKKGYTLNGYMTGPTSFSTHCQYNGSQTEHPGCINADDCEGNVCGSWRLSRPMGHGKCVDNKDPAGDHLEDYHCDCDSGFKEVIDDKNKIRYCENIDDCPHKDPKCTPGFCVDEINDYECICPAGYYEGNDKEGLLHVCSPVKCGAPPEIKHGSTETKEDVYFAEPPVLYTCDKGYTIDGVAKSINTFQIACKTDGTFEETLQCLPVTCGAPMHVSKSTYPVGTPYYFPEQVPYQSEKGYSTDGDAKGRKSFEADCEADGTFTGVSVCLPVECPVLERQRNADWPKHLKLKYLESFTVTCLPGYALVDTQH